MKLMYLIILIAAIFCSCELVTTSEEDKQNITIAAGGGEGSKIMEIAAQKYMYENPEVSVEIIDITDLGNDRMEFYLQHLESEDPEYDIYMIDVIWPGELQHHLVDLYMFGADKYVDCHFSAIIENNTKNGKLVAMPWHTSAGLLYYRSDMLDKYGYDGPPETWDELEEMAAVIMDGERDEGNEDFWGYVWQGNAYEGLTCNALEWTASNCGGSFVSPDGEITINNQQAIDIVEQAAGWVGTISPSGVVGHAEEDARATFQGGNAAFMRNWPYAYSLARSADSPIRDDFDVAPLPAGDSGSGAATLGGWQLGLSEYSANKELAADVLFFMAGYEMQKMLGVESSLMPTIKDLYADDDVLEANSFFKNLYDVFTNAVARPSTVTSDQYNETSERVFAGIHDVLTGSQTGASAFRDMEADLEDLLGFPTGSPKCD